MSRRERRGFKESTLIRWYRIDAFTAQNGRCLYCTCPLLMSEATADHQIPRSKGGKTTPDNIDAVCADCNTSKDNRTGQEFNRAINNPSLKRDGFDLYLDAMTVRIRREGVKAADRIKGIISKTS